MDTEGAENTGRPCLSETHRWAGSRIRRTAIALLAGRSGHHSDLRPAAPLARWTGTGYPRRARHGSPDSRVQPGRMASTSHFQFSTFCDILQVSPQLQIGIFVQAEFEECGSRGTLAENPVTDRTGVVGSRAHRRSGRHFAGRFRAMVLSTMCLREPPSSCTGRRSSGRASCSWPSLGLRPVLSGAGTTDRGMYSLSWRTGMDWYRRLYSRRRNPCHLHPLQPLVGHRCTEPGLYPLPAKRCANLTHSSPVMSCGMPACRLLPCSVNAGLFGGALSSSTCTTSPAWGYFSGMPLRPVTTRCSWALPGRLPGDCYRIARVIWRTSG